MNATKKLLTGAAIAAGALGIGASAFFACKGTVPAIGASRDTGTTGRYIYTGDFCILSVKADKTCSVRISSGGNYGSYITKNAKPFVSADADNLKDEVFFKFVCEPKGTVLSWYMKGILKSLEKLNTQCPGAFVFRDLDESGAIPPDATVIKGRESYTVYTEPGKGVERWKTVLYLRGSVFDIERWRECWSGHGGGYFYESITVPDYRAR